MKPKVLLDPHIRSVQATFTADDYARLEDMVEIIWGKDDLMPLEAFKEIKQELFATISCWWRYGDVREMPKLRAILEVCGGPPKPDHLDYEWCFQQGIRVLSCAPAFGPMVAEMALGQAIALARGIVEGDHLMRAGQEKYYRDGNHNNFTLYGKKIGLIGYGGLARALKPLLDPFRPEYFVYDPWLTRGYLRKQGVNVLDLNELLATCQVIFVLAIPSEENKAMLDRQRLELIQKEAVLVLISRAHVVDFDALVEMVDAGRFRASIDVYPVEPCPNDHPVRQSKNTILTSHLSGSIHEDFKSIGNMVVNDLEAIIKGLPPLEMQVVQPEIIHRL